MEDRLDGVANEGVNYINLLNEFYGPFEKLLEDCKKDSSDYKVKDKVLDEKCPECGHLLVEKNGRHGKFIGCSNFPNCRFVKPLVKSTGVSCPKCGHDIIEKVSKKEKYFMVVQITLPVILHFGINQSMKNVQNAKVYLPM